jgi:hypothetical protein
MWVIHACPRAWARAGRRRGGTALADATGHALAVEHHEGDAAGTMAIGRSRRTAPSGLL